MLFCEYSEIFKNSFFYWISLVALCHYDTLRTKIDMWFTPKIDESWTKIARDHTYAFHTYTNTICDMIKEKYKLTISSERYCLHPFPVHSKISNCPSDFIWVGLSTNPSSLDQSSSSRILFQSPIPFPRLSSVGIKFY